jgi:hypothetical protein
VEIKLCEFLTAKQDAGEWSASGFGPFVPGDRTTGNRVTQIWLVPRFKFVAEKKRKYLPLTGIETGSLAFKYDIPEN